MSIPKFTPNWQPPTSDEIKALIQSQDWTNGDVSRLVGVGPRSVRRWYAPEGTSGHRAIPFAAWALLVIHAEGLIQAPPRRQ